MRLLARAARNRRGAGTTGEQRGDQDRGNGAQNHGPSDTGGEVTKLILGSLFSAATIAAWSVSSANDSVTMPSSVGGATIVKP